MAGIKRDLLRNLFGREQKIGKRAGRIAQRHIGGALVGAAFGDGKAATFLECGDPQSTASGGPAEDDGDGALALVFGERDEKTVDRAALPRFLLRLLRSKAAVLDRYDQVRLGYVDFAALDLRAILDCGKCRRIALRDGFTQPLLVEGFAMLQYDDSCVVGGRGKVGDVAFERLDGARRSADADDQRRRVVIRGVLAGRRPSLLGLFAQITSPAADISGRPRSHMEWPAAATACLWGYAPGC